MSFSTSLPEFLALVQAARTLSGTLTLKELRHALLHTFQEKAGAPYGALLDFKEGEGWVILCQSDGAQRVPSELPASVLEPVLRTRTPVVIANTHEQAPYAQDEALRARQPHSVLCWPLAYRGRGHGLLYLEHPGATEAFDEACQGLVELFAILAGMALDNESLSHKLSEQSGELSETVQQLQGIIDNSPDTIYVKDREGRFLLVNRQFEQGYGRPRSELVGRTDWELFPEDVLKYKDNDMRVFDIGATLIAEEQITAPKTHEPLIFSSAKFPLRSKDGRVRALGGISRNITAHKRAEVALQRAHEELEHRVAERTEQLRAAQRELLDRAWHAGMTEIASGILHNLGNVLNSISVSGTLLKEGIQRLSIGPVGQVASLLHRPPEALGAFLTQDERGQRVPEFLAKLHLKLEEGQKRLLEESANLETKIDHARNVIATQQTYAKNRTAKRERLQMRELVEDAVRLCVLGGQAEQLIQREYGEETAGLYERHIIVQILVNLISNAWNAVRERPGPSQPRITLLIRQDAYTTLVAVSDNGKGFDESVRAQLFAYGFSTSEKGHGFGLHSARESARFLGGRVEAHSDGPGKGARFELILPRERPE